MYGMGNDNPVKAIIEKFRKTVVYNNDNGKPMRTSHICEYRNDGEQRISLIKEIRDYFDDNYTIYSMSIHDDWLDKSKPDYEESKPDCKTMFVSWLYRGDIKQYIVSVYEDFAGEDE